MLLEDGGAVELNGEDVDGSMVDISDVADTLSSIEVTFTPEDTAFIAAGGSWTDPVFGKFMFSFDALEKNVEEIAATTTADAAKIKLTNNGGDELTIPIVDSDPAGGVGFGDKLIDDVEANLVLTSGNIGNLVIDELDVCNAAGTSAAEVEDCEGVKFLAVSSGGEARIIKIDNIDTTGLKMDLTDETTGNSISDKPYGAAINLGFMTVTITVNTGADTVTFTDINKFTPDALLGGWGADTTFQTELGAEIGLDDNSGYGTVTMVNDDGDGMGVGPAEVVMWIDQDADDDVVIFSNPNMNWLSVNEDSDMQMALDGADWGALFTYDSEDDNDMTISYPEEQVIANTYVSSIAGGSTTVSSAQPVLASAVSTVSSKNLLVVGGSCINTVAAKLLGSETPICGPAFAAATGAGAGQYVIKGYPDTYNSQKFAMLVAGYEADQTKQAVDKLQEGNISVAVTTSFVGPPLGS
jgi:hypothetical protein